MTDDEIKQKLESINAKVEQLLRQQAELHGKAFPGSHYYRDKDGTIHKRPGFWLGKGSGREMNGLTAVTIIVFWLGMVYLLYTRSC